MPNKYKNKLPGKKYPTKKFVVISDVTDELGLYVVPKKWISFTRGIVLVPKTSSESLRNRKAADCENCDNTYLEYKLAVIYHESDTFQSAQNAIFKYCGSATSSSNTENEQRKSPSKRGAPPTVSMKAPTKTCTTPEFPRSKSAANKEKPKKRPVVKVPAHPAKRSNVPTHPAERSDVPTHPAERSDVPTHPAKRSDGMPVVNTPLLQVTPRTHSIRRCLRFESPRRTTPVVSPIGSSRRSPRFESAVITTPVSSIGSNRGSPGFESPRITARVSPIGADRRSPRFESPRITARVSPIGADRRSPRFELPIDGGIRTPPNRKSSPLRLRDNVLGAIQELHHLITDKFEELDAKIEKNTRRILTRKFREEVKRQKDPDKFLEYKTIFPLKNASDVDLFDRFENLDDYLATLIIRIDEPRKAFNTILNAAFAPEITDDYTWHGSTKKKCFRVLPIVEKILELMDNYFGCTDKEIKKFGMGWFKNSRDTLSPAEKSSVE